MKQIPLTQGKFALVDDEDYPFLSRFKWGLSNGKPRRTDSRREALYMISFLMAGREGCEIMHKNNNRLDCRKENLLYSWHANISQRAGKTLKPCSSKYKGVSFCKTRKDGRCWQAYIGGTLPKDRRIGFFYSEKEAALAYNKKAREIYGELAYQNIITD